MKGYIFDLDGTLLNSLWDIAASMNKALEAYHLPSHPVDAYKHFVGNGARTLVSRAVGAAKNQTDVVYDFYMEDYKKNNVIKTAPYPGIMEVLTSLNEKNIPIAVFSNKPHRDTITMVNHFFSNIIFKTLRGQVSGIPVKPDPQGALLVAKEMDLSPESIFYVGDSGVDMDCATRANMVPVGVTWGFRSQNELNQHGAKHIVFNPIELLALK